MWAALKRTLRHRQVEIQAFDPIFHFGVSLKPESVPVDVKVLMIGTRQIYRLLHALDEDFKKIFKVKAEMAMSIATSERRSCSNYASFDAQEAARTTTRLPPFHA